MGDNKWPSEYMVIMCNILSYHVYNGLESIYVHSVDLHQKLMEEADDEDIPSILKLFQYFLKKIEAWNDATLQKEVHRIGERSHQMSLLEPLLKACVKSYIIHMSARPASKCTLIKNGFHESVELNKFIHQCYIECAELFYNNPKYFWHKFKPLVVKKHQTEILKLIKECIVEAVRRTVPLQMLLEDYLSYEEPELPSTVFKPLDIKERVNVRGKMIMLDDAMNTLNDTKEKNDNKDQLGGGVDLNTDVDAEINKLNEGVKVLDRPKSRQSTHSKHSRHSKHSTKSRHSKQSPEKPKVGVDPLKLIPPRTESEADDEAGDDNTSVDESSFSDSPPADGNQEESSDVETSVMENELDETIDNEKVRSEFFSKLTR